MQRVSVVGNSGSGKSTLARALAARLGVAHVELDALVHLPGWEELPTEELRRQVTERLDGSDGWVIDGNYRNRVGDLVRARADTVVWLDLPRRTVMRQVVGRTLRRVVTRQELWNGNREPWSNLYSRDPMRNIVLWAWTNHAKYRRQYAAELAAHPELAWVRLRSRRDVRRFLSPAGGSS